MKFNTILALAAAALLAVPAIAQEKSERPARDTRWFIGAGGGMNFGIDGKFEDYKNANYGAGTSVEAYFGKFFNDWVGFRAGYHGFSISEERQDYGRDPFHYAHADLLIRLADWCIPYVHGGFAKLNTGTPAGGVGLMMPIKVHDRVSIVPDLKATAFNGNAFSEGEKKFAGTIGGSLGLVVRLGKVKEKKAATTDDDDAARRAAEEAARKAEQARQDSIARAKAEAEEAARRAEQARLDSIARAKAEADRLAHEAALAELAKALNVNTLFDFDSAELTDKAHEQLDKVTQYLKEAESVKVEIGGHTDGMGTAEYNQTLSEKRAQAVYDYLVGKGIAAERLTAVGYGKDKPVASNDTEEGRAQNRRIEFKVK